jgi:catechol 2,3-dioxygenase-like lactoylglutathione lyase family enzyme
MAVSGLGGLFFRAKDPDALTAWYQKHFGIGGHGWWFQDAGPTVFAPFRQASDYFAADKAFMINLRIDDMAAMTAQLEAAGIEVIRKEEWNEGDGAYGQFARVHDPEGNAIELWEPPAVLPEE